MYVYLWKMNLHISQTHNISFSYLTHTYPPNCSCFKLWSSRSCVGFSHYSGVPDNQHSMQSIACTFYVRVWVHYIHKYNTYKNIIRCAPSLFHTRRSYNTYILLLVKPNTKRQFALCIVNECALWTAPKASACRLMYEISRSCHDILFL